MILEKKIAGFPGIPMLIFLLLLFFGSISSIIWMADDRNTAGIIISVISLVVTFVLLLGLFKVDPNESKVVQLFGRYIGSAKSPGLHWANPFYSKRAVSERIRNFETDKLKVNDKAGNPIVIAAVVVWKVVDTAEAVFEVDDYENFVHVQSESALRNLATGYPYVSHEDEEEVSLSGNTMQVSDGLKTEISNRLEKAGVEVIEARISHLAYAPEIAAAMLQRQQASAVVAARTKIVEGAVGMVNLAIKHMAEDGVIDLDEERKAAMVSNLMVVLCGDRSVQPVVNTGTLNS